MNGGGRSFGPRALNSVSFLAGSVAGGGVAAQALAALGLLIEVAGVRAWEATLMLGSTAFAVFGYLHLVPVPCRNVQIANLWPGGSGPFLAWLWGYQLGFGFLTRIEAAGFFVIAAVALCIGGFPPTVGVVPLILFGVVRGSEPLLAVVTYRSGDAREFVEMTYKFSNATEWASLVLSVVVFSTLVVAVVQGVT